MRILARFMVGRSANRSGRGDRREGRELGSTDWLARGRWRHIGIDEPLLPVTQHPVTTEHGQGEAQINETLAALQELRMPTIMLWPNADAGSEDTARGMRKFRERHRPDYIRFYKNFLIETWVRLMLASACVVGNSSAPIREGAYIGVPAVNIGTRQRGRDRGGNVVDVEHDRRAIVAAVRTGSRTGVTRRIICMATAWPADASPCSRRPAHGSEAADVLMVLAGFRREGDRRNSEQEPRDRGRGGRCSSTPPTRRASRLVTRTIVSTDDAAIADAATSSASRCRSCGPIRPRMTRRCCRCRSMPSRRCARAGSRPMSSCCCSRRRLRGAEHIDAAVDLLETSGADSVVSVVEVSHQFNPVSVLRLDGGRRQLFMEGPLVTRRQDKPGLRAERPGGASGASVVEQGRCTAMICRAVMSATIRPTSTALATWSRSRRACAATSSPCLIPSRFRIAARRSISRGHREAASGRLGKSLIEKRPHLIDDLIARFGCIPDEP